ncbi:MAG: hypothetical protein WCG80_19130 [Spirochaetales bacterium]
MITNVSSESSPQQLAQAKPAPAPAPPPAAAAAAPLLAAAKADTAEISVGAQVRLLSSQGKSATEIAASTGLDLATVKRYLGG